MKVISGSLVDEIPATGITVDTPYITYWGRVLQSGQWLTLGAVGYVRVIKCIPLGFGNFAVYYDKVDVKG
jgi:hypothetical protein